MSAQSPDGAAIFARDCASCHDGVEGSRAPKPELLEERSPEAILSALTAGGMRPQGARLTGAERRAVAEYPRASSGRRHHRRHDGPMHVCAGDRRSRCEPIMDGMVANADQYAISVRATGGPDGRSGAAGSSLKWAFGFPDATSAWSQPTVAGGRLFVGSQNGTVYSLDARTGCINWTFTAKSGVRTALAFGRRSDANGYAVYFGDTGANVYALDAATGHVLWSREMDTHPHARVTGSPTLFHGRLFVPVASIEETAAGQQGYQCCTFRGSLNALDAKTGDVLWRTFTVPEAQAVGRNAAGVMLWGPSGVGIWAAPTIDEKRNVIYAATGNTYSAPAQPTADAIVAVDPASGAIKWIRQMTAQDVFGCRAGGANCGEKPGPDADIGTPAMLVTRPDGRDVIVVGQKSGMTFAIDPDKEGEIHLAVSRG